MTTRLIASLSRWSGLKVSDVEYIVRSAPRRYKVFSIPKRSGGERVVAQPSRELKALQRLITDRIIFELPVHGAAHGYVKGRGIKSNAAAHAHSNFILKMDFSNFFPSIRPGDLGRHMKRHLAAQLTEEERRQLYNLIFWRPRGERGLRLCIGAPSSPFISNTIMFDLDSKIHEICEAAGIVYTRYADDLTFSCVEKGVLCQLEVRVRSIIDGSKSPRLSVNNQKTVHISRAQRRTVTGINISSVGALSIGRDRKRLIRSMVHKRMLGQLSFEENRKLNGLLAFANDIEPEFVLKMKMRARNRDGDGGS